MRFSAISLLFAVDVSLAAHLVDEDYHHTQLLQLKVERPKVNIPAGMSAPTGIEIDAAGKASPSDETDDKSMFVQQPIALKEPAGDHQFWEMVFLDAPKANDQGGKEVNRATADDVGEDVIHGEFDDESLKELYRVLKLAAAMEHEQESMAHDPASADTDVPGHTAAKIVEELEAMMAANASRHDVSQYLQTTGYDVVEKAIEEISESTDVEDAAKDGAVVTLNMDEEENQVPGTPERSSGGKGNASLGLVQNDMLAANETMTALLVQMANEGKRNAPNLWAQDTPIKFCFKTGTAPTVQEAFLAAVQHFENLIPCLTFTEIDYGSEDDCAELPSILVKSDDVGCWAHIGDINGPWSPRSSVCHLQPNGCDTMGIAAHELGHNLGMMHEQQRPDLEEYVTVFWDNIQSEKAHNYELDPVADITVPYDIMSLMHYSDTSFALAGQKTMEAKDNAANQGRVMGNRMGLTHADTLQVGQMYGCEESIANFMLCDNGEDGCTREACVCHQTSNEPGEIIKTIDSNGCQRCMERCPNYGSGTSGLCGCPLGWQKRCFTSGGKEYCGCEVIPPPTTTTTTTSTEEDPDACKDIYDYCPYYTNHCKPNVFFTNPRMQVIDACKASCNLCGEGPPPCWDMYNSCPGYHEHCGKGSSIGGNPFDEACAKTCGKC